jgi:hypothetical protein
MTNIETRRSDRASNFSRAIRIALVLAALVALSGPSASSAHVGAVSGGNTVYVAPSGFDGNLCTQTAPCLTLDRGYRAVADGGTVELAAGSYPFADP